ncbi:pheromone-like peptide [Phlebiopsis gigantea 11061_1 CR5-6]|uniref:Pheromone-like peptide n=1 Tax=Phlebiopsis gigantea (strain 11061_1 CR5-6) TaxID=745531 RepID=A0A0C3SAL2_PHLG1|nr:pheromone-like peptide [Phlebiopsis gigantea 11061_1 CR5-6]
MDSFFNIASPITPEEPQVPINEEGNNGHITSSCVIA